MKKLFPENKVTKKGLIEFLDKKGFYIVLILCILVVGAVTVFVTTNKISSPNAGIDQQKIIPDEAANTGASMNETKPAVQSSVNSAPAANVNPSAGLSQTASDKNAAVNKTEDKGNTAAKVQPEKSTVKNTSAAKPAIAAATMKLEMPVFGDVIFDYAKDKLLYSKTLEDWEAHSGIDIASERGALVKAAADGIVSEIKDDPRLGIIVVVDHQNGFKTVYANLASGDTVVPNQKIKQGDVIGSVGNTANFESAEEAHLHFEVWKSDEPADPNSYLTKK